MGASADKEGAGRKARAAASALVVLGSAQALSSATYLVIRGAPGAAEGLVLLVGNVYPFVCAAWLRRPGSYAAATRTAEGLALVVTTALAMLTGGIASPFVPILITIPSADFSVSGTRGVLRLAASAMAGVVAVAIVDALGWLDHLALPEAIRRPAALLFLVHCVVVMTAVNLGVARARGASTRALARARDAAEAASRTKSAFLAMMSHELRTPLAGLSGTLELLGDANKDASTRRYVEIARGSARSLRTLLDDILDFSKVEAGRLELVPAPCRPVEVLEEVTALFAVAATERRLELASAIDPSCAAPGLLDAVRVRQVVSNLVGNAIKFTERGRVSLRARVEPGAPPWLVVEVEDTGIGIAKERVAELFQPFVQVQAPGRGAGGTGLGLAICRRLVEAMGGTIALASEPGVGSTFTVRVPLPPAEAGEVALVEARAAEVRAAEVRAGSAVEAAREAAGSEASAAREAAGSEASAAEVRAGSAAGAERAGAPLRVLVAEDVSGLRLVIEAMLRRRGHEVTLVEHGRAALERASAERFDLILMDMQMPVLGGLEATRAIRGLPAPQGAVRIVALSADAFAENRAEALEAGCDDYLTKPIEVGALAAALAEAVRLRDAARG